MEFKKVLILTILFMLAGLGGMFIGSGTEKDSTQTRQKVKKVVVHDTVYVSNSFETYNLPKCEGALIDSLVIDKRKITTDGVPEHGRPALELFGVGYPIYLKRQISSGLEIGMATWGTTFDNPLWYSVGCHGKITPSKKMEGHITCSGEWVVLIKECDE